MSHTQIKVPTTPIATGAIIPYLLGALNMPDQRHFPHKLVAYHTNTRPKVRQEGDTDLRMNIHRAQRVAFNLYRTRDPFESREKKAKMWDGFRGKDTWVYAMGAYEFFFALETLRGHCEPFFNPYWPGGKGVLKLKEGEETIESLTAENESTYREYMGMDPEDELLPLDYAKELNRLVEGGEIIIAPQALL